MKYSTIKIENKGGKENYYTITDKKRYLLSEWYDCCWSFHEGFGIVRKDDKFNYAKPDGTFLLKDWVGSRCWNFREGFGVVNKKGRFNYIKPDGTYLLVNWVVRCWDFHGGFGIVEKDGKENYVKPDGTFLLNEWVDHCFNFQDDGLGTIIKGSQKYRVDSEGNTYFIQYA